MPIYKELNDINVEVFYIFVDRGMRFFSFNAK